MYLTAVHLRNQFVSKSHWSVSRGGVGKKVMCPPKWGANSICGGTAERFFAPDCFAPSF